MKTVFHYLLLVAFLLAGCSMQSVAPAGQPARIDTGIDPDSWVMIPSGSFYMGQHEKPVMVDYSFEMMVTHVTNAQYAGYLNEALERGHVEIVGEEVVGYYPGDPFHGHKHEEEIPAGDYLHVPLADAGLRLELTGQGFSAKSGYENHPMVQVSWFGAMAYCDFYSWRLPTETEWEKAARGDDARPFPWGDEIARNNANFYSSHDIFEKGAGKAGDTTPVGFYNGGEYSGYQTLDSPSPYGLFDMAGNVWQWTADVYEGAHYRYMRGGSKENYQYNLRVWTRNNAAPTYYSPNVGFRCARDAN